MKVFYLASPQVENMRRGRNTRDGMRKAMKEGRWVSKAPFGYVIGRDSINKPILMIDETKAILVRKAFELMATGTYPIDSLRKEMSRFGTEFLKPINLKQKNQYMV